MLLFACIVLNENREYTCEFEFCLTVVCVCVFVCTRLHPAVCMKTWHVHKRVYLVREEQ